MTKEQAEVIKNTIEEINKNSSIILLFDMAQNSRYDSSEDNWFVTIIYHITENEWIEFVSLGFNFNQVQDKLFGWKCALEATKYFQEQDSLNRCVI